MSEQDDEELDESVDIKIENTQDHDDNETAKQSVADDLDATLQSLVHSIHMEIKQEISDAETITPNAKTSPDDTDIEIKQECVAESNEGIRGEAGGLGSVKQEVDEDSPIVSYDFPQFDSTSMDSSENSAMGQVNSAMPEPYSVKLESSEFQCKVIANDDIKLENDMTVTETNLVPNKITTNYHQLEDSLVMEVPIHLQLVGHSDNAEEILPTLNPKPYKVTLPKTKRAKLDSIKQPAETPNQFQLNSITGDILPLEAYTPGYKEQLKCSKCPKICSTAQMMQKHLKVHQTIQNYASGRERAKITRRANQRKRAAVTDAVRAPSPPLAAGDYKCTCGASFRRRSRLESCMRSHGLTDNQGFTCTTCDHPFRSKEDLTRHSKRAHDKKVKKFPCKFCPTDHKSRKDLFKHLRLHQKSQLVEFKVLSELVGGREKLRCFLCSATFTDLTLLKSHVLRDHDSFTCPNCPEVFSEITVLLAHLRSHDKVKGRPLFDVLEAYSKLAKSWRCEECAVQFYDTDDLALHQRTHVKSAVKDPQFQCADCRRVFVSAKSLNLHRRIHHNALEELPQPPGLLCPHCRKVCGDAAALTTHMRFHSADRKYVCKFCDFRFATIDKRKSHAEIHTGDMRYVCFICEYRCSSENRLKNHKKSPKHLSMKDFLENGTPVREDKPSLLEGRRKRSSVNCDICGESFGSEGAMLSHKQTHPFIEFPHEDRPTRIFFK